MINCVSDVIVNEEDIAVEYKTAQGVSKDSELMKQMIKLHTKTGIILALAPKMRHT